MPRRLDPTIWPPSRCSLCLWPPTRAHSG
jgi:hypothetical protein